MDGTDPGLAKGTDHGNRHAVVPGSTVRLPISELME